LPPATRRSLRETTTPVDLLVWATSLVLVVIGVAGGNPAALLLGQVGWAALVVMPGAAVWRRVPVAAVLLIFFYIAAGEVMWLLVRVTGLSTGWQMTAALPSMVSGVLASAAGYRLLGGWISPGQGSGWSTARGPMMSAMGSFLVVLVLAWPSLRGGTQLGTTQYAVPGLEHMHNVVRAAVVDRTGMIPYGRLSPAHNVAGDYYPRGFHLVVAWLNASVDVDLRTNVQQWIVGYLRLFWLVWALVALSLATMASQVFARLGHRQFAAAAVLGGCVIFLPFVYDDIVLVGFSSYVLGIFAVSVSLTTYLCREWSTWTVLTCVASFVVASHGWLVLAVVPLLLTAHQILVLRRRKGSAARGQAIRHWSRVVALSSALALIAIRPWVFTYLSGDATSQAKENGAIAQPPTILALGVAAALALVLFWPSGRALLRSLALPVAAFAIMALVGVRAAGWDTDLYYPRKMFWALILLLAPIALACWLHLGDWLIQRVLPIALGRVRVLAGAAVVLLACLSARQAAVDLLLDRPLESPSSVRLAEHALDRGAAFQLVSLSEASSDSNRVASMWGRAARDIRGLQSVDVSEIDFNTATPAVMCARGAAMGVPVHVVTRQFGRLTEQPCGG